MWQIIFIKKLSRPHFYFTAFHFLKQYYKFLVWFPAFQVATGFSWCLSTGWDLKLIEPKMRWNMKEMKNRDIRFWAPAAGKQCILKHPVCCQSLKSRRRTGSKRVMFGQQVSNLSYWSIPQIHRYSQPSFNFQQINYDKKIKSTETNDSQYCEICVIIVKGWWCSVFFLQKDQNQQWFDSVYYLCS